MCERIRYQRIEYNYLNGVPLHLSTAFYNSLYNQKLLDEEYN